MSLYTPLSDKIVNGVIADADDVMNELRAIGQAFNTTESSINNTKTEAIAASTKHTDDSIASITIDGGTY